MEVLLILWNILVLWLYGEDKRRSIKRKRRISEKTLLNCAFFMGGTGALFGMLIFRHKTKKGKFKILIPLFIIINILVCIKLFNISF